MFILTSCLVLIVGARISDYDSAVYQRIERRTIKCPGVQLMAQTSTVHGWIAALGRSDRGGDRTTTTPCLWRVAISCLDCGATGKFKRFLVRTGPTVYPFISIMQYDDIVTCADEATSLCLTSRAHKLLFINDRTAPDIERPDLINLKKPATNGDITSPSYQLLIRFPTVTVQ